MLVGGCRFNAEIVHKQCCSDEQHHLLSLWMNYYLAERQRAKLVTCNTTVGKGGVKSCS